MFVALRDNSQGKNWQIDTGSLTDRETDRFISLGRNSNFYLLLELKRKTTRTRKNI